ncbi:hypothetical protein AaE_013222, partial [Aphanomyces astaci]
KTTPVQKTTSKGPTQKAVQPSVAAKPASAPALVKRASLTPVQQLEQTQILNILLDDAGKDWKPRDKTPKQPVHKHAAKGGKQARKAPVPQKTGAQKANGVQNAQKSGAAPAVAAKPAPALVKRASLTPVQQAEQQQILNILIDDAGKDWKPRNISTWPWSPKASAPSNFATQKAQTLTKTQTAQEQKMALQTTKHIQAKANQGLAKLAT